MNSIIELYTYIKKANELVKKVDGLTRDEFVLNEEVVSAYFAIFKDLVSYIVKLDKMFMIHSEFSILIKEIYEIDRIILNEYKLVNADMLYDFYKVDYKRLYSIVTTLVK